MKKKIFTRPVCVMLSDEMFDQIKAITDKEEISLSDYIREAIQEKLSETKQNNNKKEIFKMSNITKQSADILSVSEPEFIDLLGELQDFLKTKLEPCKDDQGAIYYWTCGVDHFYPPIRHDPFKNFAKFCLKKNLDQTEFKTRIENYSGHYVHCECHIVNHVPIKA